MIHRSNSLQDDNVRSLAITLEGTVPCIRWDANRHRLRSLRTALYPMALSLLLGSTAVRSSASDSMEESPKVGPSVRLDDYGSRFLPPLLAARQKSNTAAAMMGSPPGTDVPLGGWNEPAIAVNPTNSLNIAYASLFELRVTTDGGTTWQDAVVPQLPTTHVPNGDPSLAFDRDGRLFWSSLGGPIGQFPTLLGSDIFVAQCDPMTGHVLPGYPVNVTEGIGLPGSAGNVHDKQWLAADFHAGSPFVNRLYLIWTNFPPTGGSWILATHSSDQGMTWSPAVVLQGVGSGFNWPAHIAVGPGGDVYAAFHRQPGFVNGVPDGVSGFVRFHRSTDGGVTFAQMNQPFTAGFSDMTFNVQTTNGAIPGTSFWLQGSVQPWVLADPNIPGRIYVVANDDPDNNVQAGDAANVYIARSTDHGASWSAPLRVDRGPGTTFQVMPTAAIDPVSGAIVVHYYDNRMGDLNADGNYLLDVFAAVSLDGGSSFLQDFKINDLPFDSDAGARCRFGCGALITDVWTNGGGNAYAVASSGHFLSYDNDSGVWQGFFPSSTLKLAVWGSSDTDVFICGAGGEILHYDGSQIVPQISNTTQNLIGLDGRSASDVFAVGANGTVLHYNGSSWSPTPPSGTTVELRDAWANPTGDLFVVGTNGTFLQYDGVSWEDHSMGSGDVLDGVWGVSDGEIYVSGNSGALHRWNGTTWTTFPSGLPQLFHLWGVAANDVVTLGFGRIRRFDGSSWSPEDVSEELLLRVHGSGPGNIFAVGENGFIAHYDGSQWTPQANPLTPLNPTKRIGEYNGVAAGGGRTFAVWCGNTQSEALRKGMEPLDQQTMFDSFETTWPVGISVVDLTHRSSGVILEAPGPNPTERSTTVAYSLPQSTAVDLSLIDVRGRRIATLVRGHQPAGRHVVSWDGKVAAGGDAAAGVYFLRLKAGQETRTQRVTFIP